VSEIDPTKLKDPTWQFAFGAGAFVIGFILLLVPSIGSVVFFILSAIWLITATVRHSKIKKWLRSRQAI